jgi:predicted Zn-dependent protease/outer membrane lipoprotein-sorting protein
VNVRALVAIVSCIIVAGAVSCRDGEPPPPAADAIESSAQALEDARAFVMRSTYVSEYESESIITEQQTGYEEGDLMYAHLVVSDDSLAVDDVTETLYIPDDLFLRTRGGTWYVRSPWNMGISPDELASIELDDPVDVYREFVDSVSEIQQTGTDDIAGEAFLYYEGVIVFRDVPRQPRQTAHLWLHEKTYLPRRLEVEFASDGANARVTVEFLDYDLPPALPDPPQAARPWRDLELPTAPCTKEAFTSCLASQTALEDIAGRPCEGATKVVCLVPLGQIDPELVRQLVNYYTDVYGLSVIVTKPSEVPLEFADPLREQVNADALMEEVYFSIVPEAGFSSVPPVVIGITPVDIYDPESHFRYVLGMKGTVDGPLGIVSTFRMEPRTYGLPEDHELLYTRARKLFTKYIGLLYFGLQPSLDPQSPLYDAIGGPTDLDTMSEPLPIALTE